MPVPLPAAARSFRAQFKLDIKPRFRPLRNAWARQRRVALYRTGAFVRTDRKRAMRASPNVSQIGGVPRRHSGELATLMWFDVHSSDTAVTIGPLPFPRAKRRVRPLGRPDGRALLEFGGVAEVRASGSGRSRGRRRYGPRPYMAPGRPKAVAKLRENLKTTPLR